MLKKLGEFLPANGDWAQYIERMNQFFIANKIIEKTRKKHLNKFLWTSNTYTVTQSDCASKTIGQKLLLTYCSERTKEQQNKHQERYRDHIWCNLRIQKSYKDKS